jgi:hypothetical protein
MQKLIWLILLGAAIYVALNINAAIGGIGIIAMLACCNTGGK